MSIKPLSDFGSLSFEVQKRIESELDRGETLLWCSRQTAFRRYMLQMLPVAVFGMLFGGFASVWIVMAFSMTMTSDSE